MTCSHDCDTPFLWQTSVPGAVPPVEGLTQKQEDVPSPPCGAQSVVKKVKKTHLHNRSKHVGLRFCFVQRLTELGIISGEYNPSDDQHSDIGTKLVSENIFEHHTPYLYGEVLPTEKT